MSLCSGSHCVIEPHRTFNSYALYFATEKQAAQFLSESGRPGQVDEEVDRTVHLGQHQVRRVDSHENAGVFADVMEFWHHLSAPEVM